MRPNPAWAPDAYEETVETVEAYCEDVVVKVWGGDWCPDCRAQLPDFAAALDAAGVPEERIVHYPVEKLDDGSKTGPAVETYGIEWIPTVVVEWAPDGADSDPETRDGEEIARFVEEAARPIVVELADQLRDHAR